MNLFVAQALASLTLFAGLTVSARADELGERKQFSHSTVALLHGAENGGRWQAGLQIKLPGNWKTYWKVPGDAGIPPDFDWSGSENLHAVEVFWPTPRRYRDQAGESIGYKHDVVFPITVTPSKVAQPVHLRLKLFYAACDDICVPGQAELAIQLSNRGGRPSDIALIDEFVAKVPMPTHQRLKVHQASLAADGVKPSLEVSVSGVEPGEDADIFVSGPELAYFRQPELIGATSGLRTYRLIVDGADQPNALKDQDLEIVVTTADAAISYKMTTE